MSGSTARIDDHVVRTDCLALVPEQVPAAGAPDLLRDPVAEDHRRVEPLEADDAERADGRRSRLLATFCSIRPRRPRRRPRRAIALCSVSVIAPIVEIVLKMPSRLDGSSDRTVIAGSMSRAISATDAPLGAQTAHRAWVMIEIGLHPADGVLVHREDRRAGCRRVADALVDRRVARAPQIHDRAGHDELAGRLDRVVALVGHADELAGQAEGADDLGGRRDERDDPHVRSLAAPAHRSRIRGVVGRGPAFGHGGADVSEASRRRRPSARHHGPCTRSRPWPRTSPTRPAMTPRGRWH